MKHVLHLLIRDAALQAVWAAFNMLERAGVKAGSLPSAAASRLPYVTTGSLIRFTPRPLRPDELVEH